MSVLQATRRSRRPAPPHVCTLATMSWFRRRAKSDHGGHAPVVGGSFRFEGLSPWRADDGLIEVEVDNWLFDLHNFGYFLSLSLVPEERLIFERFHHQPGLGPAQPQLVIMTFANVRDLKVTQDDELDPRCRGETYGGDFHPSLGTLAQLSFDVGEIHVSFRASGVTFVHEPTLMPPPIVLD